MNNNHLIFSLLEKSSNNVDIESYVFQCEDDTNQKTRKKVNKHIINILLSHATPEKRMLQHLYKIILRPDIEINIQKHIDSWVLRFPSDQRKDIEFLINIPLSERKNDIFKNLERACVCEEDYICMYKIPLSLIYKIEFEIL